MSDEAHCVIRGHCGSKAPFGQQLPCPYNGPAQEPEDGEMRALLADVCGESFKQGPVCCTREQVDVLRDNFGFVETLLASCPACRNNFRDFFCSFTCSPSQSLFLNVTTTQLSYDERTAVKSLDFHVGRAYAAGFFNSCKDVKLSSANDYAMTLIGGGAKEASSFLKFLGEEKDPGPGSPFQINFPDATPPPFTAYDPPSRNCYDSDLRSRCTCIDCLDVCPVMPPVSAPESGSSCHVGSLSCLSFILTNLYALVVVGCFLMLAIRYARRRKDGKADRTVLPGEDPSDNPLSPRSHSRSLLGASALGHGAEDSIAVLAGDSRNLGRGASLLDPAETLQPRQYRLNTYLRRLFFRLGHVCATYPWLTFSIVFLLFGLMNIGWKYFVVETDPVNLWVAPDSESKVQKEFFDSHFGPFYRPQQIFITSASDLLHDSSIDPSTEKPGLLPARATHPVLSYDHLKWWFSVESEIRTLRSPNEYELSDVCFKPAGPGTPCVVQSITAWFDYDLRGYEESWKERIVDCATSPVDCLPDFRQPLAPPYVLGGIPSDTEKPSGEDYLNASALVVTIVVENSADKAKQSIAMEWERTLRDYLERLSDRAVREAGLKISFSTGVSLEEELGKSTNVDARIVVLSYLVMFFYVALTLGSSASPSSEEGLFSSLKIWVLNVPRYFNNKLSTSTEIEDEPHLFPRIPKNLFVKSKFTLGLFGIALVILSVSSSVGFFSLIGVKVTLIIAEVIPFLVLAVGVDNVFILVHELDRQNALHGPSASSNTQSTIPGRGENAHDSSPRPPTFSSSRDDSVDAVSVPLHFSAEERVARALAKMGPSILLSTITEFTAFALGALVPMPAVRNFALYAAGSVLFNAILQVTVFVSALTIDLHRIESYRIDCFPCIRIPQAIALTESSPITSIGAISRFIRRRYAPSLLRPIAKIVVLLVFAGIFVGSIISMQHIRLGLDQRLALPSDSYLISYFNALDDYLDIGPPVYFVVSDVNVKQRTGQRKLCGRFSTCQDYSVANILEGERQRTEVSFLTQPAASWIDDYLHWLDPANSCCRVRKSNPYVFCRPRDSPRLCRSCLEGQSPPWNITMEGLPEGEDFMTYLSQWLHAPADEDCALGGQAAYSTAVFVDNGAVNTSHFRTAHSPLKTQEDLINSMIAARRVANEISESIGADVFPYSIHYVYFDQYIHIIAITQEILGLGLAAVLVITSLFLGSWRTGTIVTGVVALTVINVMGIMGIWGITLNAISLVNLVISLGIAVEFCAHIARAFMGAGTGLPVDQYSRQKERDERMWTALVDVGPSVLSGITFTKLIGVSVLALTRSRLLEMYYFRMWLSLIISGALHGLVLLPVILSYAGGPGYALEDVDEEWMSSAIRRDYEYMPFLADDDSIRSE